MITLLYTSHEITYDGQKLLRLSLDTMHKHDRDREVEEEWPQLLGQMLSGSGGRIMVVYGSIYPILSKSSGQRLIRIPIASGNVCIHYNLSMYHYRTYTQTEVSKR